MVRTTMKKDIEEILEPVGACYRLTGHEYDAYGYCKVCYRPHPERHKDYTQQTRQDLISKVKDDIEWAIRASLIEGDKYCNRKVLETNLREYLKGDIPVRDTISSRESIVKEILEKLPEEPVNELDAEWRESVRGKGFTQAIQEVKKLLEDM